MRIGEAAAAAGMTTKTLRFYEDRGLLPPAERASNGYRDYAGKPSRGSNLSAGAAPQASRWRRSATSSPFATMAAPPAPMSGICLPDNSMPSTPRSRN